jgi:mixed-linked glucan synthase
MAAGQQQASGGGAKHGCVCGFPVCACAGAAAVASAASSADMDRVAVAATEGQIGAVNDESWIAVDLSDDGLSADGADPGVALEDRPVFRTEKIKGVLLHPYRYTPPPPPPPPPFPSYRSISALS